MPTSRATRVTSEAKPLSWSTMVLMVFLSARISPLTSTVILRDRSPFAIAVVDVGDVAHLAGQVRGHGPRSQAYLRSSRAQWAENVALPEVARLVDGSRLLAARTLLQQAEQYASDSPELIRLKADLPAGMVEIRTVPDGADIYLAITPTSNPVIHSGGGWAVPH